MYDDVVAGHGHAHAGQRRRDRDQALRVAEQHRTVLWTSGIKEMGLRNRTHITYMEHYLQERFPKKDTIEMFYTYPT